MRPWLKIRTLLLVLCFISGQRIIALGVMDNAASFAVNHADDMARAVVVNIDDLVKTGLLHADDVMRIGVLHADDIARLGIIHADDIARLGLRNGDDLVYGFAQIHKRAHTLTTAINNADDVALKGWSNDIFRNTQFVTKSGKVLDGSVLYKDIFNYSHTQFEDIIAAVKGQPLKKTYGNILGKNLTGDEFKKGLIERFNRINDFVDSNTLGKETTLLQGIHGSHLDINSMYGISLSGKETAEEAAKLIARNGKTHTTDMMTSTLIKEATDASTHAENYALFLKNVPVPKPDFKIVRELQAPSVAHGVNITNQCSSYSREIGYVLLAKGLKTEVVRAYPDKIIRNGEVFEIIRVIERIIP